MLGCANCKGMPQKNKTFLRIRFQNPGGFIKTYPFCQTDCAMQFSTINPELTVMEIEKND